MLTVREINQAARSGKPVIAKSNLTEQHRIIRARTKDGIVEVQALNSNKWYIALDVWISK